jgi:alpha-beta hydrolase superfamily lysophospholipase
MKTEGRMKSSDKVSELYVATWMPEEAAMPDGKPVCILQIVHGMSEYVDRYAAFAEYLNGFGVLVTGEDHIGHGHSAMPED